MLMRIAIFIAEISSRNFSGLELQRLALARLLLAKPRIVFIDERTSSLDAEAEVSIKEQLRQSLSAIR